MIYCWAIEIFYTKYQIFYFSFPFLAIYYKLPQFFSYLLS